MIRQLLPTVLLGLVLLSSCEPNNPFNTGPRYDVEGNLKIDSLKIVSYLDTARIDSIRRIHDPSGVVIIIQEEGEGSQPKQGNVIHTDYTGFLMETGKVFDTTLEEVAKEHGLYDEEKERVYLPLSFRKGMGEVITGMDIAFGRIRPKTKAVLVIPSPRGYQNQAQGGDLIPAHSVLVFKIDFLGMG